MITVAHPHVETPLLLSPDRPCVLTVENAREYVTFVRDVIAAMEGGTSDCSFWDGDVRIDASKRGEILRDYFSLSFDDRKVLTLLYKKMRQNLLSCEDEVRFAGVVASVEELLQKCIIDSDLPLDSTPLEWDALLKACGVRPRSDYESALEGIVAYIDLFVRLRSVDFFVLVGVKAVLSDEDLAALYHHCELEKVSLLLLEPRRGGAVASERRLVITEDLCEIVEKQAEI
ncbi:MAG: type II-A CRISPR-associated protein Csn2 [Clostridia bacterium]|nr:type II-A CRISPR-associated protein Csn2 [Clostridia bacterium]